MRVNTGSACRPAARPPASTSFRSIPLFFFSSRRPHTRYIGDWSSDVCSSDLAYRLGLLMVDQRLVVAFRPTVDGADFVERLGLVGEIADFAVDGQRPAVSGQGLVIVAQIGRASCREKGGARSLPREWEGKAAE